MTLVNTYRCNAQNTDLQKAYSFNFANEEMSNVVRIIEDSTGLIFSYDSYIIEKIPKITVSFENEKLSLILSKIFTSDNISFNCTNGYIILKNTVRIPPKIELEGTILEADSGVPVPYATVSIKNKNIGTIADHSGHFEITLDNKYYDDTAIFSSMGYLSVPISIKSLTGQKNIVIRLKKQPIYIPPVEISTDDFETLTEGNNKKRSKGSLYIDTQGQQAVMFLKNEKEQEGRLLRINYYLSEEGNTEAPFRIRVYAKEKTTGKPGKDVLPEILVVKPDISSGWYEVDLRTFNIEFPPEGLFVGIEGIFPDDYDFYSNENEFTDISTTNKNTELKAQPSSISYGQRLGYNKDAHENTWHYSFSHTWFQLENQKYGVMISADIQYRKNKTEKRK